MEHKTSNELLSSVVSSFTRQLIAAGYSVAEISFTLAKEATVLGLNAAPNSALAMIVVMDGMKFACAITAASDDSQHSEIDETDTAPINSGGKLGGQE